MDKLHRKMVSFRMDRELLRDLDKQLDGRPVTRTAAIEQAILTWIGTAKRAARARKRRLERRKT